MQATMESMQISKTAFLTTTLHPMVEYFIASFKIQSDDTCVDFKIMELFLVSNCISSS